MTKRLFALLAAAAVAIGACGGTTASSTPAAPASSAPASVEATTPAPATPEASPTPEQPDLTSTTYPTRRTDGTAGGQVIIGDWQEATEWNPYYEGQVTEQNVATAVWSTLDTVTDDFKYMPWDAAELPTLANGGVSTGQNGDAMTVTWKLRPGLKWSDGQPLTCDDYLFTQNWIMDKDNTGIYAGTSGYEDVTKAECPDPTTFVLHFGKIYENYLGMYLAVLPKHYYASIPVKDQVQHKGWTSADMPKVPTSGAYTFDTITPGAELRVKKNPNFVAPQGNHPPYLDTIIWKWYGDADAMIAGYKGGEVDIAWDLNDADLPKVQDLGDQVQSLTSLTYEFLRPNWSSTTCSPRVTDRGTGCPMSDPAMREALRLVVDKDAINQRLLGGNAALGYTNVSPSAWFYSDPPTYTTDPEKAKSVLDAAGWTVGADGIRVKNGLKASIELCTTTRQVRQDTLALVASELKDIGIQATVNAVSPADIFATYNESTNDTPCDLSRHKFDVAEHAFSVPLDPTSNYPVYHSGQEAPNGQNDASIEDPDVDRIMDGVKDTVDFAQVKSLMAEWQKIYVEKTIEIPLYFRKEVYLVNPKLKNFTGNPTSVGPTWNLWDWYLAG